MLPKCILSLCKEEKQHSTFYVVAGSTATILTRWPMFGNFWLCHLESKCNYVWHCTSLWNIFSSEGAMVTLCVRSTCQSIAEMLASFIIKSVLGWQVTCIRSYEEMAYCQYVVLLMSADRSSMVPLTLFAKLV